LAPEFGEQTRIEIALRFASIEIDLQGRYVWQVSGMQGDLQRFRELPGIELRGRRGVRVNADHRDDLDPRRKEKRLHAGENADGIRQQFDGRGKKCDAFRPGIEKLQIFGSFPGPVDEARPREAMNRAISIVKPCPPKEYGNPEQPEKAECAATGGGRLHGFPHSTRAGWKHRGGRRPLAGLPNA